MEEFNLSEKITSDLYNCGETVLQVEDVKEFIRRLKERVKNQLETMETVDEIIDKLAGEKLK